MSRRQRAEIDEVEGSWALVKREVFVDDVVGQLLLVQVGDGNVLESLREVVVSAVRLGMLPLRAGESVGVNELDQAIGLGLHAFCTRLLGRGDVLDSLELFNKVAFAFDELWILILN